MRFSEILQERSKQRVIMVKLASTLNRLGLSKDIRVNPFYHTRKIDPYIFKYSKTLSKDKGVP